jgi:SAM-dependent methyltransferase
MTDWDTQYREQDGLRWWPESDLAKFIGRAYGRTTGVKRKSRGCALDLGCGTGRHMWLLWEAGFAVSGIDNPYASECAHGYMAQRKCEFYIDDMASLPKINDGDGLYDLVVDCQTIQHLSEDDHALAYKEVARVLKPGGKFWSMHWREGDADKLYKQYPELNRTWSLTELGPLIESCGLESGEIHLVQRGQIRPVVLEAVWYVMDWTKQVEC